MNTRRVIQGFTAFVFSLGAVIAFAGEPVAAVAPAASRSAATSTRIPSIVITAKRLTAEQKASMDQEDGKLGRKLATKKVPARGAKSAGSVG